MKRTKKALIVVLSVMCAVCLGIFTLTACSKATLESIEITAQPAKVEYVEGDKFEATGLKVSAVYSDETKEEVTDYTLSVASDYALKTTDTKVTVTYQEKTADITIKVNPAKSLTVNDVKLGTDIKLELRDDKVYYVIAGGTYDATVSGYTAEEETAALATAIAGKIYFDLQENPYVASGTWDGDWALACTNAHTVKVTESGKFELAVDITDLKQFCYTTHCDSDFYPSIDAEDKRNHDFKPDIESFTSSVKLGGNKYTMVFVKGGNDANFWGCVGIKVADATAKTASANPVSFEVEGDKVYYVITGTCENYTLAELQAATLDFENGLDGSDKTVIDASKITVTLSENGEFTVKADITDMKTGIFWVHWKGVLSGNGDVGNSSGSDPVECGNNTYSYADYKFSWGTGKVCHITAKAE